MLKKYVAITAAAALAALVAAAPEPADANEIVFMTGPAGGSWYPLGGGVKSILESEMPGTSVTIKPGGGLVNLKGVSGGLADIGWGMVMSSVDAVRGTPPFEAPMPEICNIAALYPNYLQIMTTDLSVNTLEELKGKSLTTVPRGNTSELGTKAVLEAAGLTYDDMSKVNFASVSDSVNMMKDGQVEVFMTITSVPNGSILDLTNSRKVKFLPISDAHLAKMKAQNPGWGRLVIEPGAYPGVEQPVPIAGFPMHMIAHCEKMSEETAYNITKALATRVQELGHIVKELSTYTVKDLALDIGMPFHPGAERYYREAGAL